MNKLTSDDLRAQIADAGRALTQAREDAALYDRMKKAASEATRLQALAMTLTEKLSDALTREAKAEIVAYEATFRKLRIRRESHSGHLSKSGLMGDTFVISYERQRYDMDERASVWTDNEVRGFELLDGPMLEYILAHRPELIDAGIQALAPGDVYAAMHKFIRGKSRGHLSL